MGLSQTRAVRGVAPDTPKPPFALWGATLVLHSRRHSGGGDPG